MRPRRRMAVAMIAAAALAVITACGGGGGGATSPTDSPGAGGDEATETPGEPRELVLGNAQDVTSFDPGELDTGMQVLYWQAVYDTLLRFEPDGEITPGLATAYEYNDDKTVLTLQLREGITFTDGEPFNAEAVKANMEHLGQGSGVSIYQVDHVIDIEVLGDHEVRITLDEPDPAFVYYLTLPAGVMGSPAALETAEIADVPVGAGPYVLDEAGTIRGSQYTFTRNPDFWEPERFPYDTIVIKPFEDLTARVNAIRSGQVDGIIADPTVTDEAESNGLQVERNPISWTGLVMFGRTGGDTPALHEVKVRQALNHAIDSELILRQIFHDAGYQSTQMFSQASPAFVEELDDMYPYDPEKAKQLLADAGYPDGFSIEMPQFPGQENTVPIVDQQLREIGVDVTWKQVPFSDAVSALLQGEYDMAIFGSSSGHPWRDIHKMVSEDGSWNAMRSTDPRLDDLMENIRLSEGTEQEGYYQDVSRFLVEEAWFGVWYFLDNVFITDPSVKVLNQSGSLMPYLANFSPAE